MTVVIVKISHNIYYLLTCSAYNYRNICPGFSPGSARLFQRPQLHQLFGVPAVLEEADVCQVPQVSILSHSFSSAVSSGGYLKLCVCVCVCVCVCMRADVYVCTACLYSL